MIGKNIGVDPVEEAYFRHRVGREQYVSHKFANKALTELGYAVAAPRGKLEGGGKTLES